MVGQMVMEALKALDHVAYVRFASVYRNFTDLESFALEVEALQRGTRTPMWTRRWLGPAFPAHGR